MLTLLWLCQRSSSQTHDKATVVESSATLSLVLWVSNLHNHPTFSIMNDIPIHNACIQPLYWLYRISITSQMSIKLEMKIEKTKQNKTNFPALILWGHDIRQAVAIHQLFCPAL